MQKGAADAVNRLYVTPVQACVCRADLLFLHGEEENRTCAFDAAEPCAVRLYLPRAAAAQEVTLELFSESGDKLLRRISGEWEDVYGACDVYLFPVSSVRAGLYFARICVKNGAFTLYGTLDGRSVRLSPDASARPNIQISVSEFAHSEPKDVYGGVIYHVFVDRFCPGGRVPLREGAILDPDWEHGIPQFAPYNGAPLKNNKFFGGTLWGVLDKLAYLKGLGVTVLYLSPIFDSPSNHKYDTADYMTVDPMFGGEEALRALIEAGKRAGIRIILDGVFNHTGADSIYFDKYGRYGKGGACTSKDSPYYTWYDFQQYPDKYTCWWGIDILPRIHPDVPSCGEYFVGREGVIRHYADMGILGFRLDVADELSDRFLTKIKAALSEEQPDSMLYGEVWEDASNKIAYDVRKKYFLGRELDGVMNYPVREGLIRYFLHGDCDALSYALHEVTEHAPARILHAQMNLLGTHDTERILTVLGAPSSDGRSNEELSRAIMTAQERAIGRTRLKMAYTVLATLPGVPSVYYGDEVGMEGYHDPFNRRPFPWGREDAELLRHYRKLGRLRRRHAAYRKGAFRVLALTKEQLLFVRLYKTHAYVTAVNRGTRDLTFSCSEDMTNLFTGKSAPSFTLAPMSATVYRTSIGAAFTVK